MRTAQEIFDTVVAHLREQKATARNDSGCRYRYIRGDGRSTKMCSWLLNPR
jgi:hypothetical protein